MRELEGIRTAVVTMVRELKEERERIQGKPCLVENCAMRRTCSSAAPPVTSNVLDFKRKVAP